MGDASWDMLACVAAGMTGIAVPTGAVDGAALLDAGALVVIDGLSELSDVLRRRGSRRLDGRSRPSHARGDG